MHSRHPILAPLHRLMAFAQSIKVRRMVEKVALDPKQTFWIMTVAISWLDAAAMEWCKVFGSRGEDTHWTRVIPHERHDEVRGALLEELGLSQSEWEAYHDGILRYRNELVAHHDLAASVAKYPHYDKAIIAANFMFNQLRDIANPDELGGISHLARSVVERGGGNMSVIVRMAFQASAALGLKRPRCRVRSGCSRNACAPAIL